ncbi:MAG TPA: FtsQ-type POTRA domain-containing protein [Pseudomonadales bacterium]|nr:FtsQ-type POTRA domain-containing protein [Pseudomonadales bacterium]
MAAERTLSGSGFTRTTTLSDSVVSDMGIGHGLWLLLLQTVLVCVLIAGGYFSLPWLKLAFDKPIQRVVIRGDLRAMDKQSIENAVAIYDTDSFLTIDLAVLVNQLEAQPWIARARARRQWPDTVDIEIVEEAPIAYWGSRWMVNAKGRIFEHQGLYQDQPLPRLWSESAIPADTMNYYQVFEHQLQFVGLRLQGISQNLQGDWQLTLGNGLRVMLGRADPASSVRNFVSIYQQVVLPAQQAALVVDMRYRHGAAIRWQQLAPVISKQDKNIEGKKI